jgi:hypothetical protein
MNFDRYQKSEYKPQKKVVFADFMLGLGLGVIVGLFL